MFSEIEKAYQRYCEERFELASDAGSEKFEFPQLFCAYMRNFNGGWFNEPVLPGQDIKAGDRLSVIYGVNAGIKSAELISSFNAAFYEFECGRRYFPVGYTVMGGVILLGLSGDDADKIFLKAASSDKMSLLAKNIIDFFEALRPNPNTWGGLKMAESH